MNHSSSILSPKSIEAQRKGGRGREVEEGGGVVVDGGGFCFVLLEEGLKDHSGWVSVDSMRSKRSRCQI